jgi:hypothetical protein
VLRLRVPLALDGGDVRNDSVMTIDAAAALELGVAEAYPAGFTQRRAGTLRLGVSAAGAGHIAMFSGGPAALDGTLAVATRPGFVPARGTEYPIVSASRISGQFRQYEGLRLPHGLAYVPSCCGTGGELDLIVEG